MEKTSEKAIGIIPARFGSTRFPGKPLALIAGKPMLRHVYENAVKSKSLDRVVIATDDDRIASCIREFEGEYIMTDSAIETGTERAAVVARDLDVDIVVNIQGDEPLVPPELLDDLVNTLSGKPDIPVCTPITRFENEIDVHDPNQVKVVLDKNDRALYFSRSLVPFNRDTIEISGIKRKTTYWKHVGIYCFRKDFLMEYVKWPTGELEKTEKLEQLRILENGYPVLTVKTDYSPLCVDIPDDIDLVEKYLGLG